MKKNITRRKFVKTTLAGTAAISVAPAFAGSMGKNPYDAKGLPTRILGNTGVEVPIIGFGLGSRWMSVEDDDKALEILEYALDNGLYYWDTSASYGNRKISSEERVGKLLKNRRKEVFMVTKLGDRGGEEAKITIERSLKRLQTDHIDLLHCHNLLSVEEAELLGKKGNVLEVMHDYKNQGIVKHIGFTGHTNAEAMKRAAELYDFEVMMIALNHHVVNNTPQKFEEQAVPFAYNKGMGVIAMKVIRPRETIEGLTGEELVRYALTADHFSLANIGMDNMDVLKENLAIAKDFKPMSKDEMKKMQTALDPFFKHQNVPWMHPSYVDGFDGDLLMA